MKDKCGAEATPLMTSGCVNRIVTFMNGQLDATCVQFSDRIGQASFQFWSNSLTFAALGMIQIPLGGHDGVKTRDDMRSL
jgi:hypothetical protein